MTSATEAGRLSNRTRAKASGVATRRAAVANRSAFELPASLSSEVGATRAVYVL
jgi:hypothetical protein